MNLTTHGRTVVAIASASLVFALVTDYTWLTALGAGLVIVVAVGAAPLASRASLGAQQRLAPSVIAAGETGGSVITITNQGTRTAPAATLKLRVGDAGPTAAVPRLRPGETCELSMRLPPARRGLVDVGPVSISRSDWLNLVTAERDHGATRRLVVHPAIEAVSPLPTGHRREVEGAVATEPIEGGISFHSLRDYREGDDLRLVHWRSVAKTRTMMVRKNVVATEPRLMVVLDTASGSYAGDGFEEAVAVAASLVTAGARSRYPLVFRTTGGLGADVTPNGDGLSAAMQILAEVATNPGDEGLVHLVRLAEQASGVSVGVVTGSPDPAQTVAISRCRSRFEMVTVVQIGDPGGRPLLRIEGANVLYGSTRREVYEQWRLRFP